MTEKEDAKLRGMMLWMAECPDRYSAICGEDYEPDAEKFLQLLEELEERGYYELMLIWTMKNNINNMVDRALSRMIADEIARAWQQEDASRLSSRFKSLLREEIRRAGEKENERG